MKILLKNRPDLCFRSLGKISISWVSIVNLIEFFTFGAGGKRKDIHTVRSCKKIDGYAWLNNENIREHLFDSSRNPR